MVGALTWAPLDGGVWHLIHERAAGSMPNPPHPLCRTERGHIPPIVYRPDGEPYCRRCIYQEGVET